LQKLEANLVKPEDASENIHNSVNSALITNQGSEKDLNAAADRIGRLDAERIKRIDQLKAEKAEIERLLPPSLVTLIEQVERAKRIKDSLSEMTKATRTGLINV
jgi:septal ring factor EnvC (AmiA/AmiB activator)